MCCSILFYFHHIQMIDMPQSVYNLFTFSIPKRHLDLAVPPIGHWPLADVVAYFDKMFSTFVLRSRKPILSPSTPSPRPDSSHKNTGGGGGGYLSSMFSSSRLENGQVGITIKPLLSPKGLFTRPISERDFAKSKFILEYRNILLVLQTCRPNRTYL